MIPYARIVGFLHVGEVERKKKTEMEQKITIRVATPDDAPALLELYAPYVTQTAITFEYEVPTVEEFRSRIAHTLERYPYLVAEMGELWWDMCMSVRLRTVRRMTGRWRLPSMSEWSTGEWQSDGNCMRNWSEF